MVEHGRDQHVGVVVGDAPGGQQVGLADQRPALRPDRVGEALVQHPGRVDEQVEAVGGEVEGAEGVGDRAAIVPLHRREHGVAPHAGRQRLDHRVVRRRRGERHPEVVVRPDRHVVEGAHVVVPAAAGLHCGGQPVVHGPQPPTRQPSGFRLASCHAEASRSRGGRRGPRGARVEPGPGDLRGDRADARGDQADGGGVLRVRRRRADAGAARPADRAGAVARRRTSRDQAGHRAAGREGRRVLPEAGAQGGARLPGVGRGDLPVGAHRRRDLPDRDRRAGLVRAHGHAHLPPVAGTPHRRRPARRAAHRPRPAAGHDLHRRRAGRRRRARAARGARPGRLPEDVGQPRRPHLRAHQAGVGVHRRAARRHRLRPRAGEARRRRHHQVVEGGARRTHLRRLQPELPRPHHRVGVLAATHPRRARSPPR